MANFTVVTDADGDFYVRMPDGSETDDYCDVEDLEVFNYNGKMYLCAGAEYPAVKDGTMLAGSVYGLGVPFITTQEEDVAEEEAEVTEAVEAETIATDDEPETTDAAAVDEEDEEDDDDDLDDGLDDGGSAADLDDDADDDDDDDVDD